jgi:hypothetical protein
VLAGLLVDGDEVEAFVATPEPASGPAYPIYGW